MPLARASVVIALTLTACGSEPQLGFGLAVDPVDVLPCDFSPISGTKLSVYDCNPVFTSVDEPWANGVISMAFRTQGVLGAPLFQVWYTSELIGYETGWGLGHAVSSDGITWTPHPENPLYGPTPDWDRDRASAMTIAYNQADDEYALTYQGSDIENGSLGMGVLQSPNGIRWREPDSGSQLFDLTGQLTPICWPLGLSWTPSQGYFGFLAASGARQTCEAYRFDAEALSPDAVRLDNLPALRAANNDRQFDARGQTSVATVEFEGTFYLFYTGFQAWEPTEVEGFIRTSNISLGVATSLDGVAWRKSRNENPLPIALTDPGEVGSVGAQVIGDRIHLWVADQYPELEQRGLGYFLYEPNIEAHP
ncbi:MAG: hypothetical protein AAGA48_01535 [Myxococcota bacterium]